MLWVICGAGRGVGKTHVAEQLCAVLPDSVRAKHGCGRRRPTGPENFFHTSGEVDAFLERCRPVHQHIVLESNEWAREGRGDVVIFVDGTAEHSDVRSDVSTLRERAHLHVSADASIRDWKRLLRSRLTDSALREAVCDVLMTQKRYLFKRRPEVRIKMWFMDGGMHIFGPGLARLLEHVDRHGTLRDAASAARISYRHAWGLIRDAEKHEGQPLIIPQPGGVGGGQSILSERGRHLLSAYQQIRQRVGAFADECLGADEADTSSTEQARQDKGPIDTAVQSTPLDDALRGSVHTVQRTRISSAGAPPVRTPDEVIVETPLTIMIDGVGSFTVMCTPCDAEALAVGFAFSEGILSSADDIINLKRTDDPLTIGLRLDDPSGVVAGRNLIVTSSCGLCGQRNIDELLAGMAAVGDSLRVPATLLAAVAEDMRARQQLFEHTGGCHAAGIFNSDGEMLILSEDMGRHSAMDKAVGRALLDEQPTRGCGAVLSGRISLELVAKAARAGIELIVAVSAASSLAVEAAESANITLCGFVRGTRATVYTHPRRITGLADH